MAIKTKILVITLIMALFTCIAAPAVMGADVADDSIPVGGGQKKGEKGEPATTLIVINEGGKDSGRYLVEINNNTAIIVTKDRVSTFQN